MSFAEVLRICSNVATPLGFLGLVVSFVFYLQMRRLRQKEKLIVSLPEESRAKAIDEFLSRYNISGANLTREQRYNLLMGELEKKHKRSLSLIYVFAIVFVLCFGIASYAAIAKRDPEVPPVIPVGEAAKALWKQADLKIEDPHVFTSLQKDALTKFKEAKASEPGNIEWRTSVGAVYNELGRYKAAELELREALDLLEPKDPEVLPDKRFDWTHGELSVALRLQGKTNEADVELRKLEKSNANFYEKQMRRYQKNQEKRQAAGIASTE